MGGNWHRPLPSLSSVALRFVEHAFDSSEIFKLFHAGSRRDTLYYQESHEWPKSPEVAPASASQEASNSELGWEIIGIALAFIALVDCHGIRGQNNPP